MIIRNQSLEMHMPIGPTIYFGKERSFVDRETCIQAFRENIQKSGTKDYNILFYYGIAGIGKSKLQNELQKILDEEYPDIFWVSIDLNENTYREISTFLIILRNKIQEKCDVKFDLFNAIHAIWWKKAHPEIPLQKQNYPLIKNGEFVDEIINVLNKYTYIPVKFLFYIINNAPDYIRNQLKAETVDINKLFSKEANELKGLLPGFFAADFTSYLNMNSRAYIFIDTYEALWEGPSDKDTKHQKDRWIRDSLIANMPGVSWVISGREGLRWASICDPEWEMYLEQHPVEELSKNDCTKFMEDCGIENKDIQDRIFEASEGVPHYLNLSIDTFEKIIRCNKRQPITEEFGKTQPEIFEKFMKYLNKYELKALAILSVPNFWDRDIFELLMTKFGQGLQVCAFSELIKFSFIKMDTYGKYLIHQLMRKSLLEYQDPVDRKKVHEYYI